MLYEEYTKKVLKLARVKNQIYKFRALIAIGVLFVLALVSTLLGITGIVTEESACPSEISYGEDLGYEVEAIMSDVAYQYRLAGKSEWIDGKPRVAGTYEVRAVTKNSFGGLTFSDVHTVTIKAKKIEIAVLQSIITYGEDPILSASLVEGDRIVCDKFIIGDESKSETTITPDIDSIKIVDSNGANVSGSYIITVKTSDVTFTKRAITISVMTSTHIYDAKEYMFKEANIVSGSLAPGDRPQYEFTAKQLEVGQVQNIPTIKIYSATNKDVTDQYEITEEYGALIVDKRPLIIYTHSLNSIYDGTKQFNTTYELSKDTSLADGHKLEVVDYASIVDVGQCENFITFDVVDEDGNSVLNNYVLTIVKDDNDSTLTIIRRDVTVKTNSNTFTYDGQDHTFKSFTTTNLVSTHTAEAAEEATAVKNYNGGKKEQNKFSIRIYDLDSIDVTENYNISYDFGEIGIAQREITVQAKSETRDYSGVAWFNKGFEVQDGVLATGQEFKVTKYPSIINAGTVSNVFEYCIRPIGSEEDVTENYKVTFKAGVLTVNKKALTLTGESETKVYDGIALTNNRVKKVGLIESLHSLNAKSNGTITNVGTVDNVIDKTSVTILDGTGTSVKDNYDITYEKGTLTILARQIKVVSENMAVVYDGKAHSPSYSAQPNMVGLPTSFPTVNGVASQSFSVEVASITNVSQSGTKGTFSYNTFKVVDSNNVVVTNATYEDLGKDNDENQICSYGNYVVTFVETATLTIDPRVIAVDTKSASWVYDGTSHSYTLANYSDAISFRLVSLVEGDALVDNHTFTATMSASVKNVADGEINNSYSNLVIKDNNSAIMYQQGGAGTYNYSVKDVDSNIGKIKINPIELTIKSSELSKNYDANTLKFTDFAVEYVGNDEKAVVIKFKQAGSGVITGSYQTESLVKPTVTDENFSIVSGEVFTFDSNTIGPNVTVLDNIITLTLTGGADSDYHITNMFGKLEIKAIRFEFETKSNNKQYDGTALVEATYDKTKVKLVDGQEIVFTTTDEMKNVDDTANCNNKVVTFDIVLKLDHTKSVLTQNVGVAIKNGDIVDFGNYIVTFKFGTLTINPIVINYKTESKSKIYDGTPLSNNVATFTYKIKETTYNKTQTDFPLTIITGEKISYTYAELEKNVGKTSNSLTFKLNDSDMSTNYSFELLNEDDLGILEITPVVVSYTTATDSKVYDGAVLSNYKGTFTYLDNDGITNHNITLLNNTFYIVLDEIFTIGYTTIGPNATAATDNIYTFTLGDDDKVYSNYKFVAPDVFGTLTITKKEIVVVSKTYSWTFDGQEHSYTLINNPSDALTVKGGTLADGDVFFSAKMDAVITNKGSVQNTFDKDLIVIKSGDDDRTLSYNITSVETGTLTVNPFIIKLSTIDTTKQYDGNVLAGNYEVELYGKALPVGYTLTVITSSTTTKDVQSDVANTITGFDITLSGASVLTRPEPEAFTGSNVDYGNFQLTFENNGKISITPLVISYITNSITDKKYDGKTLTCPIGSFTYTDNSAINHEIVVENQSFTIVTGEKISYTSTVIGPKVETKPNEFTFSLNGGAEGLSNYNFNCTTTGTLTIIPLPIEVTSKGYTWDYDGDSHSYTLADHADAIYTPIDTQTLAEGDSFFSVTMSATIINKGTEPNTFDKDTIVIKNTEGDVVTGCYAISVYSVASIPQYGELAINARRITVKTLGSEQTYNGQTVISSDDISSIGIPVGQVLTLVGTDAGPNAGTYSNAITSFDITLSGASVLTRPDPETFTGENVDYGNYLVTFEVGSVIINKVVVEYQIESFSTQWDNNNHTNVEKFTRTNTGSANEPKRVFTIVTGEEIKVFTTTEKACGVYNNVVKYYIINDGSEQYDNENGNYLFVENQNNLNRVDYGKFTITNIGYEIKITTNSFNFGQYDATAHTSTSAAEYVNDQTPWGYRITSVTSGGTPTGDIYPQDTTKYIVVTLPTSITHAGEVDNQPEVKVYTDSAHTDNITDQYLITVTAGTLTVEQKEIEYTLESAIFLYDGKEKSNTEKFSGNSGAYTGSTFDVVLVGGTERLNIKTTAQIERGTYENKVTTYTVGTETTEYTNGTNGDYKFIRKIYSKLVIKDPEEISVVTESKDWEYDGLEHSHNVASIIGNVDPSHTPVYTWDESAKLTDVGIAPNKATVKFFDNNNNDVTSLYHIDYTQVGQLMVKPMMIAYTSNNVVKDYDGTPLSNTAYAFYLVSDPTKVLTLESDLTINITSTDVIKLLATTTISQAGLEKNNIIENFSFNGTDVEAELKDYNTLTATYGTQPCNYAFVFISGTLYINEIARVDIETNDQHWKYDGTTHYPNSSEYVDDSTDWGYKITSSTSKKVVGDEVVWENVTYYYDVTFKNSVKDVTDEVVKNDIDVKIYSDQEKTNEITEGVKITVDQGDLIIDELGVITITTDGYEGFYDGLEHSAYGETFVVDAQSDTADHITIKLDDAASSFLGTYVFTWTWDNIKVKDVATNGTIPLNSGSMTVIDTVNSVDYSAGFKFVKNFGSMLVKPIEFKYSTESASKIWDGKALYTPSITLENGEDDYVYTISESGEVSITKNSSSITAIELISGEPLSFEIPNITEVGTISAEIDKVLANGAESSNYKFTAVTAGKLTIDPTGILYIKTNSFTKMFDGTPLTSDTSAYLDADEDGKDDDGVWGYQIDWTSSNATLKSCDITVDFISSQTALGESYNDISVTVIKDGKDVSAGITVNKTLGKLTVTEFEIKYSSPSAKKMYDGTPIENSNMIYSYTVPSTGATKVENTNSFTIQGTTFVVSVTKTLSFNAVSKEKNVIAQYVVYNDSENITSYFKFVEDEGNMGYLEITSRGTIIINTESETWTYDGEWHSNTNLTYDATNVQTGDIINIQHNPDSKLKDVNRIKNEAIITITDSTGTVDLYDGYTVTKNYGLIEVKPITIAYDSGSKTFGYDGKEHSFFNVTVNGVTYTEESTFTCTENGLNANITIVSTNSITEIGSVQNTIATYKIDGKTVEDSSVANYVFELQNSGFLTVASCGAIEITTEEKSWDYDGQEHNNQVYTMVGDLQEGHRMEIIWSSTEGEVFDSKIKNAGIIPNVCKIIIYDELDNDVTDGYSVTYHYGNLEVAKKTIYYTSYSQTKMYDGTMLLNAKIDYTYSDGGQEKSFSTNAQGETFVLYGDTFTVQTEEFGSIGSVDNLVTFSSILDIYGIDASLNYILEAKQVGTLTITKRGTIKIISTPGYWYYDGNEHDTSDVTINSSLYTLYNDGLADVVANARYEHLKVKDVTDPNTKNVILYSITDSSGKDVTEGYEKIEEWGTFIIKPFEIGYTTEDAEKRYDGEPLTNFKVTLGNYKNESGHEFKLGTMEGYVITDGTSFDITIPNSTIKYTISIKSTTSIVEIGAVSNLIVSYTVNGEESNKYPNINFTNIRDRTGTLSIRQADMIKIKVVPITAKYDGKAHGFTGTSADFTILSKPEYVGTYTLKLTSKITKVGTFTLKDLRDAVKDTYEFYDKTTGVKIDDDRIAIQWVVVINNEEIVDLSTPVITITKRSLGIESGTDEKECDGTPLTCKTLSIASGSLAAGDYIDTSNWDTIITGTITDIGETNNTFDLDKVVIKNSSGEDVTSCYKLKKYLGTLTIVDKD